MRVLATIVGVASAGRVGDVLKQVQEIKDVTTEEEQAVLKEALANRARFNAEAVKLYKDALNRTANMNKRRLYVSCSDFKEEEKCEAHCKCNWDADSSTCDDPSCSFSYQTKEDCCANAKNVYGGCVWTEKDSLFDDARCKKPDCGNFGLETECGEHEGCKWVSECGGKCTEHDKTCEGDDSSCLCSAGDLGEALGAVFELMSCPPIECVKCLAGNASRADADCAGECEGIFHCEDEIKCFMKSNDQELTEEDLPKCKPQEDFQGKCTSITKKLADAGYEDYVEEEEEEEVEKMEEFKEGDTCDMVCTSYDKHECNTCGGNIVSDECESNGASTISVTQASCLTLVFAMLTYLKM